METFTIFFCGTAANHRMLMSRPASGNSYTDDEYFPEGEIVATLYNNCSGEEFFDKLIVDGPGSGNLQIQGNFFSDLGGARGLGYNFAEGGMTGKGWEENVRHALGVVIGKSFRSSDLASADIETRDGFEESKATKSKWNWPTFGQKKPTSWTGRSAITERPSDLGESSIIERRAERSTLEERPSDLGRPAISELPDSEPEISTPDERNDLMRQIINRRAQRPITRLNLVGWSRGGVSTIMLANLLDKTLKENLQTKDPAYKRLQLLKEINIIAYDPVPGTNNFGQPQTTLPSKVCNFISFYARDDRSFGFAPVLPKPISASTTKMTLLPIPGKHTTLVGKRVTHMGKDKQSTMSAVSYDSVNNILRAPYQVVRALSEAYLTTWGTSLDYRLPRSESNDEAMLACYETMSGTIALNQWNEERNKSLVLGTSTNNLNREYVNGANPLSFQILFVCKPESPAPHSGNDRDRRVGSIFGAKLPDQFKLLDGFINWHHKALAIQIMNDRNFRGESGPNVTLPHTLLEPSLF